MDLIDRDRYQKDLSTAYGVYDNDVSMEFDVLDSQPTINAIPIPEGATNGDMIKAMFPNIEVKPHMAYGLKNGIKVRVYIDEFSVFDLWFPTRWWNTPYKKGSEKEWFIQVKKYMTY